LTSQLTRARKTMNIDWEKNEQLAKSMLLKYLGLVKMLQESQEIFDIIREADTGG